MGLSMFIPSSKDSAAELKSKAIFGLGVAVVAVILWFLVPFFTDAGLRKELSDYGKVIDAKIAHIDKQVSTIKDTNGTTREEITYTYGYSYSVDGSLAGFGTFKSKGTFPEHRIDEPVKVVYSTRNPKMHMLQSDYSWGDLPAGLLYLLSILGFFGGLAVSIVGFIKYHQAIRQPAVAAQLPPDVPPAEDLPPRAAAGKSSRSDGHRKKTGRH